MDDETKAALELTEDDLRRMAEKGEPARVAKKAPRRVRRDINQVAAAVVGRATGMAEEVVSPVPVDVPATTGAVRFENVSFGPLPPTVIEVVSQERVTLTAG